MKTFKFIVFLFFVSTKLLGQTNSDAETMNVLKKFIKDKREVFLQPSINSYYIEKLSERLSPNFFSRKITYGETGKTISDTIFLSGIEKLYIDSCINSLNLFKWTNLEKDKYGLERFNLIDNKLPTKLPDFNYIIYTIVKPIFIRQNSICFFYYDYGCGSLCGHGELNIFIKENDEWVRWWTIFQSDS